MFLMTILECQITNRAALESIWNWKIELILKWRYSHYLVIAQPGKLMSEKNDLKKNKKHVTSESLHFDFKFRFPDISWGKKKKTTKRKLLLWGHIRSSLTIQAIWTDLQVTYNMFLISPTDSITFK